MSTLAVAHVALIPVPAIDELVAATAPAADPAALAPSGAAGIVAQLQQLAALQLQGILSPEEFERAKQQLLGL